MSAGASYYYIVGICLLAGLVFPPTSATVRAVLSSYFANHNEKASAFAVDSISLQAALIGGPLLGGSAAAFFGGTLTLVAAALVLSLSSVILTSSIPERPKGNRRSHAIALWSSLPFDALLAAIFFLALSLGAFGIAIPAILSENGDMSLTGPAFSAMAVGGMVGSLCCSSTSLFPGARRKLIVLLTVMCTTIILFSLATSSWAIFAIWTLAGLSLGPVYANLYELTGDITPDCQKTEAFSWLVTAGMLGNAAGAWAAGTGFKYTSSHMVLVGSCAGCFVALFIVAFVFRSFLQADIRQWRRGG